VTTIPYKPYLERSPDVQYKHILREILENGTRVKSQQGVDAIRLIAPNPMRFRLENGFPIITDRNMNPKISERLPVTIWQQAIGEIFAFVNGVRTLNQLEEFGCYWWKDWATVEKCRKRGLEPGDLGPGSYGPGFSSRPTANGTPFGQFAEVLAEAKENPHLRTLFIDPWIPEYIGRRKGRTQKVVVAPCHGWVHIDITPDRRLTLHMFQRSADVPVGVPSNMAQYAALTLAIAHVLGVEPYEYVHSFSNAHIFVNQLEAVEKMLERKPIPLPTVTLKNPPDDIFSFRRESFELSDYNPHPGIKEIPVAI